MENQLTRTENKPTIMRMILEKASKIDLIRSFSSLTLQKIVQERYPSVGQMKVSFGQEKTEKAIQIIIHDLSSSLDGKLDQDSVEEITAEICNSIMCNLSLEEIFFVCRKIKTSDTYGPLTINKVLKALNNHFEERTKAFTEKSFNDHLSTQFNDPVRISETEKNEIQANKLAFEWYLTKFVDTKNTSND